MKFGSEPQIPYVIGKTVLQFYPKIQVISTKCFKKNYLQKVEERQLYDAAVSLAGENFSDLKLALNTFKNHDEFNVNNYVDDWI